jgi:hypothetical protein
MNRQQTEVGERETERRANPLQNGRQDKATPARSYAASGEPPYAEIRAHSEPKHHGSQKRRVKEVSGCISLATFEALERMRDQGGREKLSRSAVVGALITRGVQGHTDMQYSAMLVPAVTEAIREEFAKFGNRYLALNARIAYQVGQILILLIKYIGMQLQSEELLHRVVVESETAARVNITRRTPQFEQVKETLKQALEEDE